MLREKNEEVVGLSLPSIGNGNYELVPVRGFVLQLLEITVEDLEFAASFRAVDPDRVPPLTAKTSIYPFDNCLAGQLVGTDSLRACEVAGIAPQAGQAEVQQHLRRHSPS